MIEPSVGPRGARALGAVAVGLLTLHLALGWMLRAPALGAGHDDAVYLLLGRGLFDLSYRSYWIVGAPTATQYPPVYPALLAISGATAPGGFPHGVALNLLLSTAALGIFTALAWRWSPVAAVSALAIAAVNPALLGMAGRVASEPAFGLFLYLTLWCAVVKPDRWYLGLLAALAAAFSRSIGVAVVAGLFIYWLSQRRWRPAAWMAMVGGLTLGSWFVRAALAPGQLPGQSYLADAQLGLKGPQKRQRALLPAPAPAPAGGDTTKAVQPPSTKRPVENALLRTVGAVLRRVRSNISHYATRDIPSVFFVPTLPGTIIDNVLWLVVLIGLGGAGAVALGRANLIGPIVAGCYFAILFVWPYVLERFLIPVIPMIALVLAEGARHAFGRIARWLGPATAAAIAVVLTATGLAQDRRAFAERAACDRLRPYRSKGCFERVEFGFLQVVADVDRLTPPEAALLTPKAASVYYLIGRRAVGERFAGTLDPDQLDGYLRRQGADYVLVSQIHSDQATIAEILRARCREWQVIASRGDGGSILLRRGEPGVMPSACEPLAKTNFTRPPPDR